MKPAKWNRRRGVMTVFSSVAAVGFVAAAVAPAVSAVTTNPQASAVERSKTASTYDLAREGAQTLSVDDAAQTREISRDSYSVYVKPTPTPTPEPVVEQASNEGDDGGYQPEPFVPTFTGGGSPQEWMAAAGIAAGDYGYVDYIVSHESGWNPAATNSGSGACGLVQALPCSKVPGNGYNPIDNLRWGNDYAVGRYGSWANAYTFWTNNSWW